MNPPYYPELCTHINISLYWLYLGYFFNNFEYLLCFPILAKHAYEEGTLISKTDNPIGTGNYKITRIDVTDDENYIVDFKEDKKTRFLTSWRISF